MVKFIPGKWSGSPPKGQMTPRERVGIIYDGIDLQWEVLYWKVKNKLAAAQVHIRKDLSIGRKIFFPTEKEARDWTKNPIEPTVEQIKTALRKCQWHEPSHGLIQIWVEFK